MGINRIGPPCPKCGSLSTTVYRTVRTPDHHFWRQRICASCEHRFTTIQPTEIVAPKGSASWFGRTVFINWAPLRPFFAQLLRSTPC